MRKNVLNIRIQQDQIYQKYELFFLEFGNVLNKKASVSVACRKTISTLFRNRNGEKIDV